MKLLSENIKPKRQQDCLVLQSIESSYRKKSNFDFLSICFSSYFASNLSLRINLHKLYTLQSGSRAPPSTNLHFHTLELFWPKYHYYRKRLQNLQIGPTSKLPAPHFLLRYFIVCWFAAQPWATSSLGGGNFWGKKQVAAKQGGKRAKMPRDDSGFTAVAFSLFPTFWCTHKPNSKKVSQAHQQILLGNSIGKWAINLADASRSHSWEISKSKKHTCALMEITNFLAALKGRWK